MEQTVEVPLEGERLAKAREVERERKRLDPDYITCDEARGIPIEVLDRRPELRWRIERSVPDWPETRMTATEAFRGVPPGEGETVEAREVATRDLFVGGGE